LRPPDLFLLHSWLWKRRPEVSPVALLVGLASGMLMAALGIALWSGVRGMSHLSRGARGAAWLAASLLVFGALLAWGSKLPALEGLATMLRMPDAGGPVSSMILMAALAIPFDSRAQKKADWSRSLLYLPALLLAGTALARLGGPDGVNAADDWVTPIRFLLTVCAGLGARALGQALRVVAVGNGETERSGTLAYGLLTLVAGSAALVNLWQQGTVWAGTDSVMRGGMAGAWLAWSADRLASSWHPRLRATVTAAAASLLILVAVKGV
jgi:hypothetical protein